MKRLVGGGFDGVVEADGGWKENVGATFCSVAGAAPNLIGVPGLNVWSPPKVSALGGAVLEPAAEKSKKENGLFEGVDVPFDWLNNEELLFSFSDSEPESAARVMRERRLPFEEVLCLTGRATSSSSVSASDSPNLRFGDVFASTEPTGSSPSSSESSWLLEDGPDEIWPKIFGEAGCAVMEAAKIDWLPVDGAGLARRGVNNPFAGVDAPVAGLLRVAKGFGTGVEAPDVLADPGRLKPETDAASAFSLARRSASSLSYRADHSASVSSSES